ncbi:MAG: tol-pal system protein YbgF [Betaproteobacteria bacterium]
MILPFPRRSRRRPQALAACAALVLVLAAQASRAGIFDDNEARRKIDSTEARVTQIQRELDARLGALEQQLKSQGLVDLFNQVEQLKADIARLRGQVEVLTNDIEQQQKRQRDLYVDLDTRLRKIESAPVAPTAADTGAPVSPTVNATPGAGEQKAYDAALDQFKRADYAGAIGSFGAFVKSYPQSPLAASAQYWVGNAQFARRDFRAAIVAQRTLIQQYPDSPKVPDAMLNVASAQSELGDNASARKTLEDLIVRYPSSEATTKAKQRLAIR